MARLRSLVPISPVAAASVISSMDTEKFKRLLKVEQGRVIKERAQRPSLKSRRFVVKKRPRERGSQSKKNNSTKLYLVS